MIYYTVTRANGDQMEVISFSSPEKAMHHILEELSKCAAENGIEFELVDEVHNFIGEVLFTGSSCIETNVQTLNALNFQITEVRVH